MSAEVRMLAQDGLRQLVVSGLLSLFPSWEELILVEDLIALVKSFNGPYEWLFDATLNGVPGMVNRCLTTRPLQHGLLGWWVAG